MQDSAIGSTDYSFLRNFEFGCSPNEVESCENEIFAHARAKGIVHTPHRKKKIYEETNVCTEFALFNLSFVTQAPVALV